MIRNKYIEYLRSINEIVVANYLSLILAKKWMDELQVELNKDFRSTLTEDGVLGPNTLFILGKALQLNKNYLSLFISNMDNKDISPIILDPIESLKQPLMNFLADAEGINVHINGRTETRYTTPYGVYSLNFPNSEPVKYVDGLFKKYKLNKRNKHDIIKINKFLTKSEKLQIQNLAWEFYKKEFMDKSVLVLLNDRTSLSYLSIAINGGKRRGNKAIQSAVGAYVDGYVGKQTLFAINKKINEIGYDHINFGMLEYMILFYARLIRSKHKFRTYINGWYNRLVKTSCEIFRAKYRRIPA